MAKLGKDLMPGDRLSLTGHAIADVIVGPTVLVTLATGAVKEFGFGQVVYLFR